MYINQIFLPLTGEQCVIMIDTMIQNTPEFLKCLQTGIAATANKSLKKAMQLPREGATCVASLQCLVEQHI